MTKKPKAYQPKFAVQSADVHKVLSDYMLADGYDYVLNLEESSGAELFDARSGRRHLDFFTCYASTPIGFNHPKTLEPAFLDYLAQMALNKPSNSDIYTEAFATFVHTLFEIAIPDSFKYSFFIEGGALAIENALKAAFDWKVRQNFRKGYQFERGHQVLHFRQAFHGRSGYTMSLTNTDPNKTNYYPKFDWPRVPNPAVRFPLDDRSMSDLLIREHESIDAIKHEFATRKDDIAAIIMEPIQAEGGDNHFRPEFLQQVRQLADENGALLIFDEVQTGLGLTGTYWVHEQLGVTPDIMVFGKKMQVCGLVCTDRIDTEPENVFKVSSRINSTWGGNLVDMIRSTKYLEIIDEERMLDNVKSVGASLMTELEQLAEEYPNHVSNIRGRGLFTAFDFPSKAEQNQFVNKCFDLGLFILPCGERSIRFRPALNLTMAHMLEGMGIIREAMKSL